MYYLEHTTRLGFIEHNKQNALSDSELLGSKRCEGSLGSNKPHLKRDESPTWCQDLGLGVLGSWTSRTILTCDATTTETTLQALPCGGTQWELIS